MIPALCLALLLAGPPGAGEDLDARAELDACAARIEELKAQRRAGQAVERELDRLLVRAQDLAIELERTRAELPAPAAQPQPSPEELRERADAARDEADRLSTAIAELDVKLGDARRKWDATTAHAAFGVVPAAPAPIEHHRLLELQLRRAHLALRRAAAQAAAAKLEADAKAAEADR
jgi:hypothetical protein